MTHARLACFAALLGALAQLAAPAAAAPRVAQYRTAPHEAAAAAPETSLIAQLRAQAEASGRAAKAPVSTLDYPYGLTVDAQGNLYAANLFAGVTIYNADYKLTGTITAGLSLPAAVAVSFSGNIYVANNNLDTISIFNPQGQPAGTITDPTLVDPSSMFIDAEDTVWVLDATGTLHAYLSDGTVLASLHTGGSAVGPWGPNVTVWGIPDNGYYDEAFGNRAADEHSGIYFSSVFPDGSPFAAAEVQDQYGQEYVADVKNTMIQIWSADGLYEIGRFTTPATPYGLAVDSVHSRLYVALSTQSEIYVYSTKAPYKLLHVIH